MVENLVNTPGAGVELSSQTPASRVSYAVSQKDDDGYAKIYLKFTVDNTASANQYSCRINSYNADITIKSISLYKMTPLYVQGDVNCDNSVSAADALLALQQSVDKCRLSRAQRVLADVDSITGITASDALKILQYAVGKITKLSDD